MATTYNDIIRKRGGKAAYSIEEEKEKQWESFIPNDQFNAVLRTVLRSVRGNDIDNHKSFWINGTYGTGKSHAVAVIKHLLCDSINEIQNGLITNIRAINLNSIVILFIVCVTKNAFYQLTLKDCEICRMLQTCRLFFKRQWLRRLKM